ncbi:MAG: hypothetical protein KatS3mg031_0479 [Chitinophagales bacterium]|nr:MAG: hypothetical protein KatS3mg031_0479 [Chitinophagales bacterium]
MAKKPNDIKVIDRFAQNYLKKFKGNVDAARLLVNLITDNLTDIERIRNYIIIHEYYRLLQENNGISYLTLIQLADKFDLSERQIQNIVYKWSDKYKKGSNIIQHNKSHS